MDDRKRLVAEGYDRVHEQYASWPSAVHDHLRTRYLAVAIERGAAVGGDAIDLGCGTGVHGTKHLSTHLSVVGVDISPASVGAARRNLPEVPFVVGDMATVAFRPESVDLVTCFYSLIHVPRTEHSQVLQSTARWLRSGGVAVITMGAGDTPTGGVEHDWLGAPMYWSNWDAATNQRLVEDAGFEIVQAETETVIEDRQPVRFLWIVGRKS